MHTYLNDIKNTNEKKFTFIKCNTIFSNIFLIFWNQRWNCVEEKNNLIRRKKLFFCDDDYIIIIITNIIIIVMYWNGSIPNIRRPYFIYV